MATLSAINITRARISLLPMLKLSNLSLAPFARVTVTVTNLSSRAVGPFTLVGQFDFGALQSHASLAVGGISANGTVVLTLPAPTPAPRAAEDYRVCVGVLGNVVALTLCGKGPGIPQEEIPIPEDLDGKPDLKPGGPKPVAVESNPDLRG